MSTRILKVIRSQQGDANASFMVAIRTGDPTDRGRDKGDVSRNVDGSNGWMGRFASLGRVRVLEPGKMSG